MTGSASQAERGRRRIVAGLLIAAAGAVTTLGSMFLPWYSVSVRIRSYADLSIVANARIDSAGLVCGAPSGGGCHVSAQVGALTGGVWDWRTLIAVGAAVVLVIVAARAMRPGRSRPEAAGPAPIRRGRWRVLAAAAAATAGLVAAAILVSPVGSAAAGQPGSHGQPLDLSSSLAYGAIVGLAGALVALTGTVLAGSRLPAHRDPD